VTLSDSMSAAAMATRLTGIKTVHTLIWAFFAGCTIGIPIFAWLGRYAYAWSLIAVVSVEVLIILLNDGRCPLTGVAARYTADRRDNFDIYLPEWAARNNKFIFGAIYAVGVLATGLLWAIRRY
jgi:hypothetical protein